MTNESFWANYFATADQREGHKMGLAVWIAIVTIAMCAVFSWVLRLSAIENLSMLGVLFLAGVGLAHVFAAASQRGGWEYFPHLMAMVSLIASCTYITCILNSTLSGGWNWFFGILPLIEIPAVYAAILMLAGDPAKKPIPGLGVGITG